MPAWRSPEHKREIIMDLGKIESLADILLDKGLTAIEVEESGLRIRLEKNAQGAVSAERDYAPEPGAFAERQDVKPAAASPEPGMTEVPSPLVGVVYLAPSPESEPYVTLGQRVEKGQVICIIDAMKMLNEVASPASGVIGEICVENGAVVDYGACLFRLKEA